VPLDPPERPYAYVVPAVWSEVVERLALHGIEMEMFTEDTTWEVTNYRIEDFEANGNREGRTPSSGTPIPEVCTRHTGRTTSSSVPISLWEHWL
jgi:hypothetical protein